MACHVKLKFNKVENPYKVISFRLRMCEKLVY